VPNQPFGPLILALAVAMAPLTLELPPWAVLWCALTWGYVLVRERRQWPPVSRTVRIILFAFGLAAVLVSAGLQFDGSDFITLLVIMAGIKPLEVASRRDSMMTVFLACFLTITSLLVFENLVMTLYLFVSVWVTTGVLIQVNEPEGAMGGHLRLSARLVLVAIPMMALLFLLFPRLPGSFWGAPWAQQGRSGFSGVMRIGDVSRLALNDEPAFSVSFATPAPSVNQLYWRGIVFQRFDGQSWQPTLAAKVRRYSIAGEQGARYTVMLEPHGHRHLFALDLPATVNPVATIMEDQTLVTRRPVQQRLSYSAASFLDSRPVRTELSDPASLALPETTNPRTVELGGQWARQYATPDEIVAAGLAFFKKNGFVYTLRPDRLGVDAIDDFLFVSRKGFCEHFAAGFTVLMRAAGVPTRIVGGYHGGQWNAVGNFFTVRQSDAHVWCEVWLRGKGWVRVDPTFAVAPERIDQGLEEALAEGLPKGAKGGGAEWWPADLIDMLTMTWEAVSTRWNMWFMGFSAEDQQALMQRLGISLGRQGGWVVVMVLPCLSIAFFLIAYSLGRRIRQLSAEDQALTVYRRFLQKTARAGLPKPPHQGPLAYAGWISRMAPELRQDVDEIVGLYIGVRYGREPKEPSLRRLRRRVRQFRPRRVALAQQQRAHS
jgi:transglutaminase-like putative cysteine protease